MRSRRSVLRRASGLSVAALFAPLDVATGGLEADQDADTDEAALPAPFDAVPTIDEPTAFERSVAELNFPPAARPEGGPVPDPHHQHLVAADVVVPAWALAATRWRLAQTDADAIGRSRVRELLVEYAAVRERFRTPDGRDAVDVLLEAARGEGGR